MQLERVFRPYNCQEKFTAKIVAQCRIVRGRSHMEMSTIKVNGLWTTVTSTLGV